MANSWSFLHDEMNMSNQDYWYEDGFSLTGNPGADSPDTINFSGTTFYRYVVVSFSRKSAPFVVKKYVAASNSVVHSLTTVATT